MVIQAYGDDGKEYILTQSSTIQRVSQRLIVAIAACMITNTNMTMNLETLLRHTRNQKHRYNA